MTAIESATASAPFVHSGRSVPTSSAAELRDRTRGREIDEAPFDMLLAAVSAVPVVSSRMGGASFTPRQLYEPPTGNAHERRAAELKADDKNAQLSGKSVERLDTTSVAARRAANAERGAAADGASSRPEGAASARTLSTVSSTRQQTSPDGPPEASRNRVDDARPPSPQHVVRPSPVESTAALKGTRDAGRGSDQPPTQQALTGARPSPAATSAVPTTEPMRADTRLRGSPAQQVGRVLAAGRSGEVESVRAVAQAPASAGARSSGGVKGQAPKLSTAGGRAGATTPQPGEGADKRPNAFEDIVRSIRLQPGVKHSSARLQLDPPELGRMQVDVRFSEGDLHIAVRTGSAVARDLVTRRSADLRAGLERYGIHVDRFEVTADYASQRVDDLSDDGPNGRQGFAHHGMTGHEHDGGFAGTDSGRTAWPGGGSGDLVGEGTRDAGSNVKDAPHKDEGVPVEVDLAPSMRASRSPAHAETRLDVRA